ncbi:MAG: Lipoprotein-releasing system ATP-binding protein LolD [Alphaproteobacteria bacterium MarineAlpha8_Bin1]|nr:MAG: Lipoprotein-releasing system ATP-binding protein LolD [Alphaproteobacteria bacterium MarineAlpha8_Bin1]|tara:strand:+ start:48 stop:674 length:627 start_codon:yes stop_codon:yes gene_type:complete
MLFKVDNLGYKLENQEILVNKSFSIDKSKHLLILGPSGSGKTTLMNIMAGLLKPTSGNILFDNKDYLSLSDEEMDTVRAENFGFIFQKLHLIGHLNVEQNIILGQHNSKSPKIDELIKDIGLYGKKKQLARNLSFGESQRVAIARGVANNPKVIFADEPTSGLDDINTKKVMELIFSQTKKNNSTLIVCSHDQRIKSLFFNLMELTNE